jgi:small subunit ribosomal protein S14
MARAQAYAKLNRPHKFATRGKNRCKTCGRQRAYYRDFQVCRICLRQLALKGELPGVIKSSW